MRLFKNIAEYQDDSFYFISMIDEERSQYQADLEVTVNDPQRLDGEVRRVITEVLDYKLLAEAGHAIFTAGKKQIIIPNQRLLEKSNKYRITMTPSQLGDEQTIDEDLSDLIEQEIEYTSDRWMRISHKNAAKELSKALAIKRKQDLVLPDANTFHGNVREYIMTIYDVLSVFRHMPEINPISETLIVQLDEIEKYAKSGFQGYP